MRPHELEMTRKYLELEQTSRREAEESFKLEELHDRNHRRLREESKAAQSRADESRIAAEEAEARLRQAQGEWEAASERVTCREEHLARRLEDRQASELKSARVRTRLGGRVTSELDLAERALRRDDARARKSTGDLEEARSRLHAVEERMAPLRAEAKQKRERATADAKAAQDLEAKVNDDYSALCARRVESRSAMSRAWLYKTVARSRGNP